jgi:hypothetical protein
MKPDSWNMPHRTVALGNEFVVIESAAATVIVNPRVFVAPALSVTRMVKLGAPAVVGVPVIAPVEVFRLRPMGREPVNDQVSGVVPPVAATLFEYTAPTVAPGSDTVVMSNSGLIGTE